MSFIQLSLCVRKSSDNEINILLSGRREMLRRDKNPEHTAKITRGVLNYSLAKCVARLESNNTPLGYLRK